jgi:hypothetical protein
MMNLIKNLETLAVVVTLAGVFTASPIVNFKDFKPKPINYIGAGAVVFGLAGVGYSRRLQGRNILGFDIQEENSGEENYSTNNQFGNAVLETISKALEPKEYKGENR